MIKKTSISLAIAAVLPLTMSSAHAALPTDAILNYTSGAAYTCNGSPPVGTPPNSCSYGTNVTSGSWFGMDGNGNGTIANGEKVRIDTLDGLRIGVLQPASGSHSGAPGCDPTDTSITCPDTVPSSESPDADYWFFFGGTGMHQSTSPITIASDDGAGNVTLDFAGWDVTWNGIASIPMGGDTANFAGDTGIATLTCGTDCADGDTFTLTYQAHVPKGDASGFGGVLYELYTEGTIGVCSGDTSPPNAGNNSYTVATGTTTTMAIQADDGDVGCSGLDKSSIDLDPTADGQQTSIGITDGSLTAGTATVDTTTGVVTYVPEAGYQGFGNFSYTISDRAGNASAEATVNVVIGDVAPGCKDDGLAQEAYIDITKDASVTINVLANDQDGTYAIDPGTVAIVSNVSNGNATVNTDGSINYTPNDGYTGNDILTYTVDDTGATPKTCAAATVTILVTAAGDPIAGVEKGYMLLASGQVQDVGTQPAVGEGSWFSMETSPGVFTYVPIVGYNHIQLGAQQPALSPNQLNIDSPWNFFGNLGLHQTTGILRQLSNLNGTATLDFTVWDVSWNAIASIPMGDGPDKGIATVNCYEDLVAGTPGVGSQSCDAGDEYILSYRATVPVGDASGFGGINYTLHLEGSISATPPIEGCGDVTVPKDVDKYSAIGDCTTMPALTLAPGATATASGNTSGLGLKASDLGSTDPLLNPNDGQQCVGGCLDFVVDNVTTGEVHLVVKLLAPIPEGAVYRKLVNGRWQDFDVSGNDRVGSEQADAGGLCPGPAGTYRIGLRTGYDCLYLKITDGGPNDADGVKNGTVVDPSGVLLPGSANVPAGASKGGCSISKTPVSLSERADWFIVAGFIVWLGLIGYRRNKTVN